MVKQLEKVKDKVGYILKNYPDTRDSDKLLWLAYMSLFEGLQDDLGREAYIKLRHIILKNQTPTFESLTRVRRKYQESGMYTGDYRHERMAQAEAVREWSKQ